MIKIILALILYAIIAVAHVGYFKGQSKKNNESYSGDTKLGIFFPFAWLLIIFYYACEYIFPFIWRYSFKLLYDFTFSLGAKESKEELIIKQRVEDIHDKIVIDANKEVEEALDYDKIYTNTK
jgi:amino acid transporter